MTNDALKEKLTDAVALLRIPGIGRGRYTRLVNAFGSPAAALAATVYELETVPGISRAIASEIKERYDAAEARSITERIAKLGWAVLFAGDGEYPIQLANIPEPPLLLFRLGQPVAPDERSIAIVGTRHPTAQGKAFATALAASLAQAGILVVSGLAEGIDSAAHQGALSGGGKTIAVLGNSLDNVYPRSNKELSRRIQDSGALYSEYFPGTRPDPAYFPERNRLISGLADGVVVVEAGHKSGALITAAHALEQGRELFAVPGSPQARMSAGTNTLIKRGARLLTDIDDIFAELPRLKGAVMTKRLIDMAEMTDIEKQIIAQFASGPQQIDQIARALNLPVTELMEFLLALELKGVLQEVSGKRFVLSEEFQ
ncbi:MAG TPA: DNA-processing protein DprA [Candidatus Deferrimicrobium sp.]|nr:DNA-processing protein DprA [Candidatus Deferrimicrobium sp.]